MIDHVVDKPLPLGRTVPVENKVVHANGIEIAGDASPRPRSRFYTCQKLLCEAVAKGGENVLVRRKIEVERAACVV
jgi:hypothetical protein